MGAVKMPQKKTENPKEGLKKEIKRKNKLDSPAESTSVNSGDNREVFGVVKIVDGYFAPGDTVVRVFDRDLRRSEFLGQAQPNEKDGGKYKFIYNKGQYARAEKMAADIQVIAENQRLKLKVESQIYFQAPDRLEVNLTLQPIEEEAPKTEYETIRDSLDPVLDELDPIDLTEQDLEFLLAEFKGDAVVTPERLRIFYTSAHLTKEIGIPIEAFYGLGRKGLQPFTIEQFFKEKQSHLKEILASAIDEKIIPDVSLQLEQDLTSVDGLQLERGELTSRLFVGQLVNSETDEPLPGYRLLVKDLDQPDPDRQSLGETLTEGQGYFRVSFFLPSDSAENGTRNLRFKIIDPDEKEVAEVTVVAKADTDLVEILPISLPQEEASPLINEFVSPALSNRLSQNGVRSLKDVLALEPEDLRSLEESDEGGELITRAKLSIIEKDSEVHTTILNAGYKRGLFDIAEDTRSRFVSKLSEPLGGDYKAGELYRKARVYHALINNSFTSFRLRAPLDPDDIPDDADIGGFPSILAKKFKGLQQCTCQDCESAVSPIAYLADLLAYAIQHVENDGEKITLSFLEETFHHPFGELPASCDAVTAEIRQVRICVEVLNSFNKPSIDGAIITPNPTFNKAFREYKDRTYLALLTRLGVFYDEFRLVIGKDENIQQRFASRLGIDHSHLEELFLDIHFESFPVNEQILEILFGYRDTTRPPFSDPDEPLLETWQKEFPIEIG